MYKNKVSSDRIIVEIVFGLLCGLWTLMSDKWRWSESLYDEFFSLSVSFTNFHIKWMPLRAVGRQNFQRLRNQMCHISNEQIEKKRSVLKRYLERRRDRLNRQFRQEQYEERQAALDFYGRGCYNLNKNVCIVVVCLRPLCSMQVVIVRSSYHAPCRIFMHVEHLRLERKPLLHLRLGSANRGAKQLLLFLFRSRLQRHVSHPDVQVAHLPMLVLSPMKSTLIGGGWRAQRTPQW